MQTSKVHIKVTAGFCIIMAFSLCMLPLKWVCSWLLALTLHELFHCAAVLLCGSRLHEVKIGILGAEIVSDIDTAGKEMICYLAGPAGGMVLLLFHRIMPVTALCALVHSVYNLLPLKNLDGGRALHSLFRMFCSGNRAETVSKTIDRIARFVLLGTAIYFSWYMQWLALALFVFIALFCKHRNIKSTCKRSRLRVQYVQ